MIMQIADCFHMKGIISISPFNFQTYSTQPHTAPFFGLSHSIHTSWVVKLPHIIIRDSFIILSLIISQWNAQISLMSTHSIDSAHGSLETGSLSFSARRSTGYRSDSEIISHQKTFEIHTYIKAVIYTPLGYLKGAKRLIYIISHQSSTWRGMSYTQTDMTRTWRTSDITQGSYL